MKNYTSESFGLLIAYLIPGSIVLWGLSRLSPAAKSWLGTSATESQTVGDFLYATVAAIFCGLVASTVRWATIDPLHHWTGIKQPAWNLKALHARTTAFEVLIAIHYRYYQHYSNSLVAMLFAAISSWIMVEFRWWQLACFVPLAILYFVASRDTIRKYYQRVQIMLEHSAD